METKKKGTASFNFDEGLFTVPNKYTRAYIVDAFRCKHSYTLTAFHSVSIHRRAAAIFDREAEGEIARNFKYIQQHKTRPLMIPNAVCS